MKSIELLDKRFGKLTVISYSHSDGHSKFWNTKCDCGGSKILRTSALTINKVESCGCMTKKLLADSCSLNFKSHGLSRTRIYTCWIAMKSRCYYQGNNRYYRYGGRGIYVCEEWLNDFNAFYEWAINNGYKENLQLDRINNNGNYEPNNCKFSTPKEQAKNRRNRSKNGFPLYEKEKQEWIAKHPNATQKEYDAAMIAIARKLGL